MGRADAGADGGADGGANEGTDEGANESAHEGTDDGIDEDATARAERVQIEQSAEERRLMKAMGAGLAPTAKWLCYGSGVPLQSFDLTVD